MSKKYRLQLGNLFTAHRAGSTGMVQDASDQPDPQQIEAWVASGDTFVTLATAIDNIADTMPTASHVRLELEQVVRTLIYLQHNYQINSK
jgi:hypothetical protein